MPSPAPKINILSILAKKILKNRNLTFPVGCYFPKKNYSLSEIFWPGLKLFGRVLNTPLKDHHKLKRISKRVLQQNKSCQIFQKTNISYPLIRTRTCAYQGVRYICFLRKIWLAEFYCYPRFEICPFALLPTNYRFYLHENDPIFCLY